MTADASPPPNARSFDLDGGPLDGRQVVTRGRPERDQVVELPDDDGVLHRYQFDDEIEEFTHLEGAVAHYVAGFDCWGVSYDRVWLPGSYDTEETALHAATLDDAVLAAVHHICRVDGENRPITRADLDAAAEQELR